MNFYKTDKREPLANLDMLPIIDRSLINNDIYFKYRNQTNFLNTIPLLATRGCPFKCAYCHNIWDKKQAVRSAENIIEEIKIYYDMGVRRFAFLDDVFNLNVKNSERFFNEVIKQNLNINLFFQNGVRGDLLTRDYIDLMVEAGTVYLPLALETSSQRLQEMIGKRLNLEKLHDNIMHLCSSHPDVILALYFMVGFPTETEQEAVDTVEFVKSVKWIHFPEYFNLIIYSGTEMEKIALENGVSAINIQKSMDSSLINKMPETFPFEDKNFAQKLRLKFIRDYWMNKERLSHVIPYQMKHMTEQEILWIYNDWTRKKFASLEDLLTYFHLPVSIIYDKKCKEKSEIEIIDITRKIEQHFKESGDIQSYDMKILLLDVTSAFEFEREDESMHVIPPMGILSIASYIHDAFNRKVHCRLMKVNVDYHNENELLETISGYQPDMIGLSVVTMFRDAMHQTACIIKRLYNIPIVVGGAHSGSYKEILSDDNIDIVVIGEGEKTFYELIDEAMKNGNKLPGFEVLKKIPGIAFRLESNE